MSHSHTLSAIVLKTYDIADADRFCILLTRERGKIAARAKGVRKLKSRMGGSLLPFQQVQVQLHESSNGSFLITGASIERDHASHLQLQSFLKAEQAAEMLLATLEDDHPVPEIFNLTAAFLKASASDPTVQLLQFTIRFLHLLGVLPGNPKHPIFEHVTESDKQSLEQALNGNLQANLETAQQLQSLCDRILEDQMSRSPKAPTIAKAMNA